MFSCQETRSDQATNRIREGGGKNEWKACSSCAALSDLFGKMLRKKCFHISFWAKLLEWINEIIYILVSMWRSIESLLHWACAANLSFWGFAPCIFPFSSIESLIDLKISFVFKSFLRPAFIFLFHPRVPESICYVQPREDLLSLSEGKRRKKVEQIYWESWRRWWWCTWKFYGKIKQILLAWKLEKAFNLKKWEIWFHPLLKSTKWQWKI